MKKKMAILMTALVGTMAFALVGCKTKIGWIDKKICDHDECKLVEVVEEATCEKEGERLMECVDCGKKITEKVEKAEHTDDGEGTCEVCEETLYELVTPEVGELVAGNCYRLYRTASSNPTPLVTLSNGVQLCAMDNLEYGYAFSSGPLYRLEGLKVEETDEYIDFYLEEGTYMYVKYNDGTVVAGKEPVVIDKTTSVNSIDQNLRFVRVLEE